MKKILSALIFIALSFYSYADWDMVFCQSLDAQNNCVGKSTSFLSDTALQLTVLLQNSSGLKTNKVYFEICKMDPITYAEDLLSSNEVASQPTQSLVYYSFLLSQKGHYLIKARDAFKDYITSREVEIK